MVSMHGGGGGGGGGGGLGIIKACPGGIYKSVPGGVEVLYKLAQGCFSVLSWGGGGGGGGGYVCNYCHL